MRINFRAAYPIKQTPAFFGVKTAEKQDEVQKYADPAFETSDRHIKLKVVLVNAKLQNERLTLSEVAQRAGLTFDVANNCIREDESLKSLWFWVKSKDYTSYNDSEKQEQTDSIREHLKDAAKKKKSVTTEEIANASGIEKHIAQERISADKSLLMLRRKTLKFEDESRKAEISKIRQILEDADINGLKVTQVYISKVTNIPVSTVSKRISEDAELEKLFKKTRAQQHNTLTQDEIAAQYAQIANVLHRAEQTGEKLTIGAVVSRVNGMKANTVSARINSNCRLAAIWENVKDEDKASLTRDEISEQTEKTEQVLTETMKNNERISLKELADDVQITQRMLSARIQSSQIASVLWEITSKKANFPYTADEIEVQNTMLERVLRQRIKDGMKATYYQLAQYLDLSEKVVKQRIEENPSFLTLYNQSQAFDN